MTGFPDVSRGGVGLDVLQRRNRHVGFVGFVGSIQSEPSHTGASVRAREREGRGGRNNPTDPTDPAFASLLRNVMRLPSTGASAGGRHRFGRPSACSRRLCCFRTVSSHCPSRVGSSRSSRSAPVASPRQHLPKAGRKASRPPRGGARSPGLATGVNPTGSVRSVKSVIFHFPLPDLFFDSFLSEPAKGVYAYRRIMGNH
jgi:hypothetical protein